MSYRLHFYDLFAVASLNLMLCSYFYFLYIFCYILLKLLQILSNIIKFLCVFICVAKKISFTKLAPLKIKTIKNQNK